MSPIPARLGSTPGDYARIGIEAGAIKPWEDGLRTDGSEGTYEWWYFDAHLEDDATLVVVFLTKIHGHQQTAHTDHPDRPDVAGRHRGAEARRLRPHDVLRLHRVVRHPYRPEHLRR